MHPVYWAGKESTFEYKYSGGRHLGRPATPLIIPMFAVMEHLMNQVVDWIHVTYYPGNKCALGAHSDNESQIAPDSSIGCLTFLSNPQSVRTVFIKSK